MNKENKNTETHIYEEETKGPKNRQKKHRIRRRRKKAQGKPLNILYVNVNGIRSKIASLQNAVDQHNSHIVAVVETKGKPPKLQGYTWESKQGKTNKGGVAIAIRNDIHKAVTSEPVKEQEGLEIIWIQLSTNNSKISIGTFYGKQENVSVEESEEEFAKLTAEITN